MSAANQTNQTDQTDQTDQDNANIEYYQQCLLLSIDASDDDAVSSFVNRVNELAALEAWYSGAAPSIALVWGRRLRRRPQSRSGAWCRP